MGSYTLGVIGCGDHAYISHVLPGIKAGFRLAAAFDPVRENAVGMVEKLIEAELATAGSVAIVDTLDAILEFVDLDVIIIASPDKFHAAQLLKVVKHLKARKRTTAILVEKPLGLTGRDMRRVLKALKIAKRCGIVISSCHPRRMDPPYAWVKRRFIALEDAHGPLEHVELDFSYSMPTASWKQIGLRSLLLDHFGHEIDYLRWLLGDKEFSAVRRKDNALGYTVDGLYRYGEEDVTFAFRGTRKIESRRVFIETIRLRFAHAELVVNAHTGETRLYDHETEEYSTLEVGATDYDRRFYDLMVNLRKVIAGREPCYLTPADLRINAKSAIRLAGWRRRFTYHP